jgi:hypothetical protein
VSLARLALRYLIGCSPGSTAYCRERPREPPLAGHGASLHASGLLRDDGRRARPSCSTAMVARTHTKIRARVDSDLTFRVPHPLIVTERGLHPAHFISLPFPASPVREPNLARMCHRPTTNFSLPRNHLYSYFGRAILNRSMTTAQLSIPCNVKSTSSFGQHRGHRDPSRHHHQQSQ